MITNPAEGVATSISTRVRDIAGLLSKAAKNYQVYLPNNRMFLASLEDARKALGEFLDVHEVLTLVVKEFELLYEGVSVYSNPDKHGSIAFRMYRDGVRLISFHRGITNAEMVAFFEALTKCMESESLEDDFVTLLWEKDLQSITYYEVNEFEGERDRKPAPSLSDSRTSFVRPDLAEMHWAEVARDADKFRPALDLTAVDLKEAQDLSFVVEDDLFLKRTWHVICSTLDLGNDKDSYLDLESAVIGFLDACLETRQIGFAADALAEVRARYGGRADEDTGAALARIVASRHTDRNMEAVGNLLSTERETYHEKCMSYLSQLGNEACPSVMRLLPKCSHQSSRQVVIMSLATLAKDDPAAIVKATDEASPEEAEVALDALAAVGTEAALLSAMEFKLHVSPRIRSKVAALASRLGSPTGLDVAKLLTQDQDPAVRKRALSSLVDIGGEKCSEILTGLFTSDEFNLLPHDRKTSMLLVIKKLPAENQRDVIANILKMRGLLKRRQMEDTKSALVDIMHLMDKDLALEFLTYAMRHSSRTTRRSASAALKRVDDEGMH